MLAGKRNKHTYLGKNDLPFGPFLFIGIKYLAEVSNLSG